jgi:hypothetical protein
MVVDKKLRRKQKRVGKKPTPNCYQTSKQIIPLKSPKFLVTLSSGNAQPTKQKEKAAS